MAATTTQGRAAVAIVWIAVAIGAVVVLLLALLLSASVEYQAVHVIGVSMSPTLNPGDYALARKTGGTAVHRGNIVVIRDPFDPHKDFIKRVVALPGERLRITGGVVSINGTPLSEPYLNREPWTVNNTWPAGGTGFVIPRDSYFVMGDNRNHSSDSTVYGPVQQRTIEAVVFERVWPAPGAVR